MHSFYGSSCGLLNSQSGSSCVSCGGGQNTQERCRRRRWSVTSRPALMKRHAAATHAAPVPPSYPSSTACWELVPAPPGISKICCERVCTWSRPDRGAQGGPALQSKAPCGRRLNRAIGDDALLSSDGVASASFSCCLDSGAEYACQSAVNILT